MVNLYVNLIIRGRKTFDDVPFELRDAVEAELRNRGYGTDGEQLPPDPEPEPEPEEPPTIEEGTTE